MTGLSGLHEALLELGLEDWIPLPEAATAPEVVASVGEDDVVDQMSRALLDLLRLGRVEIWSGHWDVYPSPVPVGLAEPMLQDRRRYSFDAETENGLDRVYYANVENFRSSD